MSQEQFDPNGINYLLGQIKTTLDTHVSETREYRKLNDQKHDAIEKRISGIEGDKKKLLGIALGAGGLPHVIAKLFGSGAGQ